MLEYLESKLAESVNIHDRRQRAMREKHEAEVRDAKAEVAEARESMSRLKTFSARACAGLSQ